MTIGLSMAERSVDTELRDVALKVSAMMTLVVLEMGEATGESTKGSKG